MTDTERSPSKTESAVNVDEALLLTRELYWRSLDVRNQSNRTDSEASARDRGLQSNTDVEDIADKLNIANRDAAMFVRLFGKIPCLSLDGAETACSSREFFGSESKSSHFREALPNNRDPDSFEHIGTPPLSNDFVRSESRKSQNREPLLINSALKPDDKLDLIEAYDRFMEREEHGRLWIYLDWRTILLSRLREFLDTQLYGASLIRERTHDYDASPKTALNNVDDATIKSGVFRDGRAMVRVKCASKDIRVHSSPAYFVDWTYFGDGAPIVDGWLSTGRYIFATDGTGPNEYLLDDGVFSIPNAYLPNIKRF
jgi:hypothetical protein